MTPMIDLAWGGRENGVLADREGLGGIRDDFAGVQDECPAVAAVRLGCSDQISPLFELLARGGHGSPATVDGLGELTIGEDDRGPAESKGPAGEVEE